MNQLGQPTWKPGSPAGYDDIAASWAAPEALMRRVEVAQRLAARAGSATDPRALAEKILPGALGESTRTAIARAESPAEGSRLAPGQPGIREEMNMLTRRFFLGAGGATAALASLGLPRMAFARVNTSRRFVFIIQRGAADGLHIVAPTGDPAFAGIRGDFAQDLQSGAKLGSFFTLHPALAETAKMYAGKEALFVHAVASPYRDRSHFDGQNVLETGGTSAYQLKDGWMNRLLGLLPQDEAKALALSDTVPMALRGGHEVGVLRPIEIAEPVGRPACARRQPLRARSAAARAVEHCDADADDRRGISLMQAADRMARRPARSQRRCSPARTARESR